MFWRSALTASLMLWIVLSNLAVVGMVYMKSGLPAGSFAGVQALMILIIIAFAIVVAAGILMIWASRYIEKQTVRFSWIALALCIVLTVVLSPGPFVYTTY